MSDSPSPFPSVIRRCASATLRAVTALRTKSRALQVALLCGLVVAVHIGIGWIRGNASASRARLSAKKALAESSRDLADIQKQLSETELRIKEQQALTLERRAQNELDARTRAAKEDLDRKKRLEESERRKADAIAKLSEDRAKQMAASRAEAEAKSERERQNERLTLKKRADEQASRSALAEELFSRINLRPRFLFSKTLKSANSKTEVRGQGYQEVLNLSEGKDWLALLNQVERGTYKEYPSVTIIEGAARALQKSPYKVLCQTRIREKTGSGTLMGDTFKVLLIKVVGDPTPEFQLEEPRPHPDGIGYYFEWSPRDGDCTIFYAPVGTARDYVRKQDSAFRAEVHALLDKHTLAEIDDAALATRREEIRIRIRDSLFEWALKQ